MSSLAHQVAIITGARGIGGATARLLAARGAQVIVTYRHNHQAAQELCAEITAAGGAVEAHPVDVLASDQMTRWVAEVAQRFGRIDICVSNAAVGWLEKPFAQLAWAEYAAVVDNELKAAFGLTQAILPIMMEQRAGRLIYMASNLADHVLPDTIASSSAKAALLAFMRNIAGAYGAYGITANAVSPALVRTASNEYIPHAVLSAIEAATPLGRVATPEDVAGVVAMLASEDSRFMTGQCLVVDGGISLHA